ncbi:MAG TPA: CDP-alcohol phosphatidyltransferase family protein [Methanocorpusculum sp.]|nr:CDP-alcohol phosphatidyltransferase family protein [Methanocorpusculum sp.]
MNITSIRHKLTGWTKPIIKLIAKTGISPNMITLISFILGIGAAVLFAFAYYLPGAILLAVSGFFDLTDGGVARINNRKSRFGAFIDWIADKYIDGIVLLGIGLSCFVATPWYLAHVPLPTVVYVAAAGAAVIGSIMNTFIKPVAYAEIGFQGKENGKITDPLEGVGFFGRPETFILLILGGLTGFIWIAVLIIAVCTNISAIQRIIYLWKKYGKEPELPDWEKDADVRVNGKNHTIPEEK